MQLIAKLGANLTLDDYFCGAGGETTGAKKLGIRVRNAFNHSTLAIESHRANHPEANHIQADIGSYDPYAYKPSVMAWFSPECKTFSMGLGKSQKHMRETPLPGFEFEEFDLTPRQERSRVTAGDILRHVEAHRYEVMIVENVVQFRGWERFDDWLQTLINFGYDYQIVYLNSMFCHPTPQSRDRMYVCLWRRGNRKPDLDIRPLAYCDHCGHDVNALQTPKPTRGVPYMKYRDQYTYNCPTCGSVLEPYYYAAANIINWNDPGKRIGDRKKPLADTTMERIRIGLKRFSGGIIETAYTGRAARRPAALYDPLFTQTARQTQGVFLAGYHNDRGDRCYPVDNPLMAVDGSNRAALVTLPFLASTNYFSERNRGVDEPLDTVTGAIKRGLVTPPAFLFTYNGSPVYKTTDDALPTVVGKDHFGFLPQPSPEIEDCFFRMLSALEVKRAMGFPSDYVLLGNQKSQVDLAGQAVTPDAARVLLERMIASLN